MVIFVMNELKITSYILLQNEVSVQNVRTFKIYVFSTVLRAAQNLKQEYISTAIIRPKITYN